MSGPLRDVHIERSAERPAFGSGQEMWDIGTK
jgi:hypothetical protein